MSAKRGEPCYPCGGLTPLWLRLEQNCLDNKALQAQLQASLDRLGRPLRKAVCYVSGKTPCNPKVCNKCTRPPAVHLTYIDIPGSPAAGSTGARLGSFQAASAPAVLAKPAQADAGGEGGQASSRRKRWQPKAALPSEQPEAFPPLLVRPAGPKASARAAGRRAAAAAALWAPAPAQRPPVEPFDALQLRPAPDPASLEAGRPNATLAAAGLAEAFPTKAHSLSRQAGHAGLPAPPPGHAPLPPEGSFASCTDSGLNSALRPDAAVFALGSAPPQGHVNVQGPLEEVKGGLVEAIGFCSPALHADASAVDPPPAALWPSRPSAAPERNPLPFEERKTPRGTEKVADEPVNSSRWLNESSGLASSEQEELRPDIPPCSPRAAAEAAEPTATDAKSDTAPTPEGEPWEQCGELVTVKMHCSMGCAIVSLRDPRLRDLILEDVGHGILINGISVQVRPHVEAGSQQEASTDMFVVWGGEAERATPLSEDAVREFFAAQCRKCSVKPPLEDSAAILPSPALQLAGDTTAHKDMQPPCEEPLCQPPVTAPPPPPSELQAAAAVSGGACAAKGLKPAAATDALAVSSDDTSSQVPPRPLLPPPPGLAIVDASVAREKATGRLAAQHPKVAVCSYIAEFEGYLSVDKGDRVRVWDAPAEPGDPGCNWASYVYSQRLLPGGGHEAGWLPVEALWDCYADESSRNWLHDPRIGAWIWEEDLRGPKRT